jgi:hypothetical protein
VEDPDMPTYLCHGFRWHRDQIRIFVIIHDLEDAAPDWILGYDSSAAILNQLYDIFPFLPELQPASSEDETGTGQGGEKEPQEEQTGTRHPIEEDAVLMHQWSAVKLLEEYDVTETTLATRPYAYMADHVVRVELSTDVVAEMAKYEARSMTGTMHGGGDDPGQEAQPGGVPWLTELKDKIQPGEEIRWYIVVCDDVERDPDTVVADDESNDQDQVMEDIGEGVSALSVVNATPRSVPVARGGTPAVSLQYSGAVGNDQQQASVHLDSQRSQPRGDKEMTKSKSSVHERQRFYKRLLSRKSKDKA